MKTGVPDATAHRSRPQSPHCSTALPRWWDVVVTKNFLTSPALPPLKGHCLPSPPLCRGPEAALGGRRAIVSDIFLLVPEREFYGSFATATRSRALNSWLEETGAGTYHRFAWSLTIVPLVNLRLQRPFETA